MEDEQMGQEAFFKKNERNGPKWHRSAHFEAEEIMQNSQWNAEQNYAKPHHIYTGYIRDGIRLFLAKLHFCAASYSSSPLRGGKKAGPNYLSEEVGEVLCNVHFPDPFASSSFRGFDHDRIANFFSCLSTFVETINVI